MDKKNLVIGYGEIGQAITAILQCDAYDPAKEILAKGKYDVLHICFPYFDGFAKAVINYRELFNADLVIIHSTVPVFTTEKIGDFAVHSPCRGVHPHLEKGIRTFVKFFGGKRSWEAADQFPMLKISCTEKATDTELMKLIDTTIYGINILMEKETMRLCEKYGADFNIVYTASNKTYNEGYRDLGMQQFQKYNIEHRDGPIGGHCIMPNVQLFNSWMAELLREQNKRL